MNPWPISPLGTQDLDFAVVNYGFTDLTGNEIGPLPPLEAAMDTELADIAASIADQTILIASMAGDLDDLFSILNEVGTDDFGQVLADLAGTASTGDSLLNDFTSIFGGPPPPPPPPPPGGSGGGSGGGGSGGSGGGGSGGSGSSGGGDDQGLGGGAPVHRE